MKFRDRVVLLSSLGFALGMLSGVIITAMISTASVGDGSLHLFAPEFLEAVGDPVIAFFIQALAVGIYGMIAFGGSSVYYIEEWSELKATLVHFPITVISYYVTGFALRWFSVNNLTECFVVFLIFVVLYVMIWLGHYFYYRSQIETINRELASFKTLKR